MATQRFIVIDPSTGKWKEVIGSVTGTADAIPAGDGTGRLDISWLPPGVGAETIQAMASENLADGDFVNLFLSGGVIKARKADATTISKPADGFVLASVALGATATVYRVSQTNTHLTGLTIGSRYYLSTTPGLLTTTAPSGAGNLWQYIGIADSATELVFDNTLTVERA